MRLRNHESFGDSTSCCLDPDRHGCRRSDGLHGAQWLAATHRCRRRRLEDVSHLLVKPEAAASEFDFNAPRDDLPDPNIDWVVTLALEEPIASRERISGLLDIPWLESHQRPTVYGFSPDVKLWTCVNATDSPESFSSLMGILSAVSSSKSCAD